VRHLHKRNRSKLQNMVMSDLLDSFSSKLHQKVVKERRGDGTTETFRRRRSQTMEMSWLQSAERCPTELIHLLVSKGDRPKDDFRSPSTLLRKYLRKGENISQALSSSLRSALPCWALSSMYANGPFSSLLLWKGNFLKKMYRD
jgi:hypothetical protein